MEPFVPRLFAQITAFLQVRNAKKQGSRHVVDDDSELPRVDIFITHCGESDSILMKTARAALAQRYPSSLVRVIILDDSASNDIAASVTRVASEGHPSLLYTSRRAEVKTHSKAANLNYGLRFVDAFKLGGVSFVAVLDVDMIPQPQWLRSVMSHVLHDPQVALASTWQWFYNIPSTIR